MANRMQPNRVQLRRDTEANWIRVNPILADCELAITKDTTPKRIKIGDGVSRWTQLSYLTMGSGSSTGGSIVSDSSTNGNIIIDGTETNVYTHPTGTNPHGTTATDVGLGDVPNVATNDQTPTYTEADTLTTLTNGETVTTAFGKIAKAISSLISHITDISNPHSVTKAQVGLGNVPDIDTSTTVNITDSLDKRLVTDEEKARITNAVTDVSAKLEATNIKAGTNVTVSVDGNDVTINSTAIESSIVDSFYTTTGLVNNMVVSTSNTFDNTVDGCILNVISNLTNTGSVLITVDDLTAKAVKKFDIDSDVYVDLASGDLKKNTPATLIWSLSNDFFVYAPKVTITGASNEWTPDSTWAQDLRTWTPDDGIGLIISNFGYGKVSFGVTTANNSNYTVVINDGTQDISTNTYASGVTATVDVGMGDGNTTYAVKITSSGAITRWYIQQPSGINTGYFAPLLWFYGNLSSLTSCSSMFYLNSGYCSLLQSVFIKSTANVTDMNRMFQRCLSLVDLPDVLDTSKVTGMNSMFQACTSLTKVPSLSNTANVNDMSWMFQNCSALKEVPELSTAKVTTFYRMCQYCTSLQKVPTILNNDSSPTMNSMFNACSCLRNVPTFSNISRINDMLYFANGGAYNLKQPLLDLSTANLLVSFSITQAQGFKGLLVSSSAPWSGPSPQIEITDCGFDRTALVTLFNSLGTVSGKVIRVTGNIGTSSLTADDLLIATNKGWTVTTV